MPPPLLDPTRLKSAHLDGAGCAAGPGVRRQACPGLCSPACRSPGTGGTMIAGLALRTQLRPRLDGLSDEEYFWVPSPGAGASAGAGRAAPRPARGGRLPRSTWPGRTWTPPPVTTIAWRLAHIMVGCFVMRLDNEEFGGPTTAYRGSYRCGPRARFRLCAAPPKHALADTGSTSLLYLRRSLARVRLAPVRTALSGPAEFQRRAVCEQPLVPAQSTPRRSCHARPTRDRLAPRPSGYRAKFAAA